MNSQPILVCENVSKRYKDGDNQVDVLNDVSFSISSGEHVAVLGSSGSGKSTLLHILGGLDSPSSGSVSIDGARLFQLSSSQLATVRNEKLGFIYQFHHLLAEFNALENVAMPLLIGGQKRSVALESAKTLLDRVGLSHRLKHLPSALSGGERQRVAIARALVNNPSVVLADEPTGNLDDTTGQQVYMLLAELSEQLGTSFVVVTHDQRLANSMDRILTLTDGNLVKSGIEC